MNLAATMSLSAGAFLGPLNLVRGSLAGVLSGLAATGGAALSLAGFMRGLRGAVDFGDRMADLSARTGIAVADLVTLEQAFKNAGVSADSVGAVVNTMQRSLAGLSEAGEGTQDVFRALGLDMGQLAKLAPTEQLAQIAEKLRALPSVAQQSAAAMKIFGRGGGALLPLLKDAQALTDAAAMIGQQGAILARNAGHFDRASDILAAAPVKLRGFFVGAAESISASLLAGLEQVNAFDFTTLGQKFGAAIAPYLEAIKSGQLWELVRLQLTKTLAVFGAKLAQLLVVDLPAMWVAGTLTPILWVVDRLKAGLKEAILWFAEKWNKIAPARFQIDGGAFQGGEAPRSMGQIWDTWLAKMPQVDWGRTVGEPFDFAINEIMATMRRAAATNLGEAQKLGGAAPDLVGRALHDFFAEMDARAGGETKTRAFSQDSDRLARIGGFIGGGGGPALDYARRTARATEQLVGLIRLVPGINPGAGHITPTWL